MKLADNIRRVTVYLDSDLHQALKIQAAETSTSVSELVNRAVKEAIAEDRADLEVFESRIKEPTVSYGEMIKRLNLDG